MWIFIIFAFLISFLVTLFVLPYVKKWVENKKILKEDNNKFKKPRLQSLEGVFCIIIFISTVSLILGLQTLLCLDNFNIDKIIAGLLGIVLIAFINFIDDVLKFPKRSTKVILIILAIMPVVAIGFDHQTIDIPFVGPYYISIFYSLLIIPLTVLIPIVSINALRVSNRLAVNNYIIISLTLGICSWLKENYTTMIIFSCLLGIFLILDNYYDIQNIKFSLGKIGRSSFGAIFGIGAIVGNIKAPLLILIIPHLVYFIFIEINKFRQPNTDNEDNKFEVVSANNLYARKIFKYMFLAEIICAIVAVSYQIYRINPQFIFKIVSY